MCLLLPQSSHFGRAMEVAVKGKSPSYLHLFPHSSAGDRGGFSKPGGKLTSITLVSPLKPLTFLSKNILRVLMCFYIVVWKKNIQTPESENIGVTIEFFSMPETIFSGVLV